MKKSDFKFVQGKIKKFQKKIDKSTSKLNDFCEKRSDRIQKWERRNDFLKSLANGDIYGYPVACLDRNSKQFRAVLKTIFFCMEKNSTVVGTPLDGNKCIKQKFDGYSIVTKYGIYFIRAESTIYDNIAVWDDIAKIEIELDEFYKKIEEYKEDGMDFEFEKTKFRSA